MMAITLPFLSPLTFRFALDIVTRLTQTLRIADDVLSTLLKRYDMVTLRCQRDTAFCLTNNAQRIALK
jgi:hypothetical protein